MNIKFFIVPEGVGTRITQDYLYYNPEELIVLDASILFPEFMTKTKKETIKESFDFINSQHVEEKKVSDVHVVKSVNTLDDVKVFEDDVTHEGFEVVNLYDTPLTKEEIVERISNGLTTFDEALAYRIQTMGDVNSPDDTLIELGFLETSGSALTVLTQDELASMNDVKENLE